MPIFITHKDFVEGYKSGKFIVNTGKQKEINELISPQSEEVKQLGNVFWNFWRILIPGFVISLIKKYFVNSLKNYDKYAIKFMLKDESMFNEALLSYGVKISDAQGNEYTVDRLNIKPLKAPKTNWIYIFIVLIVAAALIYFLLFVYNPSI